MNLFRTISPNWRNQAIALKFRLLSIPFTSEAFNSNRNQD
jgi:hypothetical protein